MKICSKEALILGGVYMVLATPFSLLGFSVISDILFIVFVILFVVSCIIWLNDPLVIMCMLTE